MSSSQGTKANKTKSSTVQSTPPLETEMGSPTNVLVEPDDTGHDPIISLHNLRKYFNFKKVDLEAQSLQDFLAGITVLSRQDREAIIDQALVLIEQVYVHLPLKQAMHAAAPVQRLKLLRHRNARLDEMSFHREMIGIFTALRDLHTRYILPEPYRQMVVFLPFLIESFYKGKKKKYMVSKIFDEVEAETDTFKKGVVVTHWNGIPIHRAVALNGDKNAGSNAHARHARGLERMTIRPLMMTLPPDEEWVDITYRSGSESHTARFNWSVSAPPTPVFTGTESKDYRISSALGVDLETEMVRRVKKPLFSPKGHDIEKQMKEFHPGHGKKAEAAPDSDKVSVMPDIFAFRSYATAYGPVGYIRIYSFNVENADHFVEEFTRICRLMPREGLVIDVRANAGGLIAAGEKLLQVLGSETVEPQRLHFINSPLMLTLCREHDWLAHWADSIERSIETGAIFSQGFPLEPVEEKPAEEVYTYPGPVVLITDALCYSTTDMFAAGFKDNRVGTILGLDGNTGAGGANAWSYELLEQLLPKGKTMKSLPKNASFSVAIRRTTRVGENMGMPLEDLGVTPDVLYRVTKADLLEGNPDLIAEAARIISEKRG